MSNNNPFGRRNTPAKSPVQDLPVFSANFGGTTAKEGKHSTMTTNHTGGQTPVRKTSHRVSPGLSQTSKTEQKTPLRSPV